MKNFLKHFFKDESGMGVVEVILIIVVLIGLVIISRRRSRKSLIAFLKRSLVKQDKSNDPG